MTSKISERCFCAFCRTPRRVYRKRHINAANVWLAALASLLLMLSLWQSFDPRVCLIFVLCLALSEIFVQLRWRLSLPCPHCGFDPLLYVKDPALASQKVKETYEVRKQQPDFLLRQSPLHELAREQAQSKRLQKSPRRLLSKRL